MFVKEPEQGNSSTTNDECYELDISVLVGCEFVNQDLRASNVDESPTSQAENQRAHESWCILNANTDTNACGFNEGKTEENEENGFL